MRTPLHRAGFAMITVLLMLVVLMALIGAYFALTRVELSTRQSSAESIRGFYSAEGGLNLRAADIRADFQGYGLPSGTGPTTGGSTPPCQNGNDGTGALACKTYTIGGQQVETYVIDATNPSNMNITIPPGEDKFAGLSAIQYRYKVYARSLLPSGKPSAIVRMDFLSRLVPLFQFAAFYQNDLEIEPSPTMTLAGPVHTNGNLYLNPYSTLKIGGQVTTAGDLVLGQSPQDGSSHANCPTGGDVQVVDPTSNYQDLSALGCGTISYNKVKPTWGTMIQPNSGSLTIPDVSSVNPTTGNDFWDKADLRIMAHWDGNSHNISSWSITTQNGTATLPAGCTSTTDFSHTGSQPTPAALYPSNSFYNHREGKYIKMVNVDVEKLLTCIHDNASTLGFDLNDTTNGGLVVYVGFDDNSQNAGNSCTTQGGCINDYGVRLLDGSTLGSSQTGAPDVQGLTVVTNQAAYVQGDYNVGGTLGKTPAIPKLPAAVIADSLNVLSNAWQDDNSCQYCGMAHADTTTINAAFLSGTDVSGPNYSGGLENYPRFHENWSGDTLHYRGSFVSLGKPMHVDGPWSAQQYSPPGRDFNYDTDFSNAANLPPLTPRFVYLKQLLFARNFTQ